MNLGVLSYIKTLDGYKNHKPIIALSTDVFEDYFDYFINDGILFIISVQQVQNLDVQAVFTISAINANDIESIYIDEALDIDVTKVKDVTTADFKPIAKTLIEGLASGECNYNIPYTSAILNLQDKVVVINDTAVVSGDLFSVDNVALEASMFANTGSQGEVYKKKRIICDLGSISAITIPLNAVNYTPMKNVCGKDALTVANNYISNLEIDKGVPMTTKRAYHKGEHVYVNVDINGTVSRRYYVSKIEGNPPMKKLPDDDSEWLDITNDVVKTE